MPNVIFSITKSGDTLRVVSPYHPWFIKDAKKNLHGRWNENAWVFDARNEQAVRALVKRYYGYEDNCALVSLRVDFGSEGDERKCAPVYRAGRVVASATGRDSGARLGQGVILERGNVNSSGSMKNWTTVVGPNTVVLIHDVPLSVAKNHTEGDGGYKGESYEIVAAPVVEPASAEIAGAEALQKERLHLQARLVEIEELLAQQSA